MRLRCASRGRKNVVYLIRGPRTHGWEPGVKVGVKLGDRAGKTRKRYIMPQTSRGSYGETAMKKCMKKSIRRKLARGFTLLEMMLVVLIIGLLMAVAVMNFAGQGRVARERTTKASLGQLKTAISTYYLTNGSYPLSLQTMVPNPLERVSKDAWREEFVYVPQSADPTKPYMLYSKGEDKQQGTQDDISVWNIDE